VAAKQKRPRSDRPPPAKRPVAGAKVPPGKRVVRPPNLDRSRELLAWRLSTLDIDGRWGWRRLDEAALQRLHEKLQGFETMTADELFGPRRGNKQIPVEDLPREAFRRLEQLQLDDMDGLCELRIKGDSRIWGFRRGNVINVLWWDPDHTVFPGNR
jgi:hypothetical protein